MLHTQAVAGTLAALKAKHTPGGRRDADRAVTRWVLDPDAPMGRGPAARLEQLRSLRHRRALARAVRRDTDLGLDGTRLAPPVARLLARNCDDADRIAAGLERADVDPRAVIETERLLETPRPSLERLAWIARVVVASDGGGCG
ncbi:MAG TPA: hypothetical protein VGL44_06135 [Gaiellales bacterium]|jgi:hypothetical protein